MSELSNTIKQICEEKGLSLEAVVGTIELALAAAYRKDFGEKNQNINVEFDIETGKSKVFDIKTVVEDMPEEDLESEDESIQEDAKPTKSESKEIKDKKDDDKKTEDIKSKEGEEEEERKFNPKTELQISDAKEKKKTAKIGDEIKTKLEVPGEFGRMAAQTAKQVIIQRLREAERDMIFNEFKEKEHEVISGVIQRREGRIVLVDLGRSVGILTGEEQIYNEQYKPGERIKIYVKDVKIGSKGPEIILSRTSDEILKKIFYLEIPEISNGLVELKSVAREAGSRSKVAVAATSDNIDPIGSCVGQRGARIQTIINELGGEKVDIIEYDEEPQKFIANALSPAKVINIDINEKDKKATVKVASDQLSLAIGKGGQNVRLAARLTGWKIDIKESKVEKTDDSEQEKEVKDKKTPKESKLPTGQEEDEKDDVKKSSSAKASEGKEKKEDKKKTEDSKQEKEVKEEKKENKKKDKKKEKSDVKKKEKKIKDDKDEKKKESKTKDKK